VRRLIGLIVHNWPLKLAAVGLATLMYGGLALSQNTQSFAGVIQVRVQNQPENTVLLAQPDPVTQIRYYAPPGVPVGTSTFRASIDLDGVQPTGTVTSVRIEVDSPDGRVRVLGFEPAFATIQLDKLVAKDVPIKVDHGAVPPGLELGDTTIVPTSATVSGAASVVAHVVWATASVIIQPSGVDVDQDVELVPIDGNGNAVSPVDVTPSTARVTIPVFSNKQSKSLPVNPVVTGTPAAGFEVASVKVTPQVVLVQGDADQLSTLAAVDTQPVPLAGASTDQTVSTGLALPTGVVPVDVSTVVVAVELREVTGTRTFSAGLNLVGARSDYSYQLPIQSVLLTVGGSAADLDRLAGATLVADLEVAGLAPGVHEVPVTANLPAGTTLVAASPSSVRVTVSGPTPSGGSPGPAVSPAGG